MHKGKPKPKATILVAAPMLRYEANPRANGAITLQPKAAPETFVFRVTILFNKSCCNPEQRGFFFSSVLSAPLLFNWRFYLCV
jgi:hypothetical protein